MFLKNAWFVAAWDHEVAQDLKQIMVLDEKISIFRNESGEVIAHRRCLFTPQAAALEGPPQGRHC
ncbi:hypothetical protein [uncultured Lentibacter sp.]|jgi:hypothetical protein|uniref:hypothetical protein n=1 Tax=uncultured Lentibacter sp. TaxID=1659309 RepID=UPI00260D220B|nr:hypothetical protein [uncultured Lentibacter sp.]